MCSRRIPPHLRPAFRDFVAEVAEEWRARKVTRQRQLICYQRWTDEDIKTMFEMKQQGYTFIEIGLTLGRTTRGCQKKLAKLTRQR